jgi:hypothetical protein
VKKVRKNEGRNTVDKLGRIRKDRICWNTGTVKGDI